MIANLEIPAGFESAASISPGGGHIEIERVDGQSAVTSTWAASPLKILIPRPRGESVWAYLSSFGGGMVAGDETRLTVALAPKTRCFLSTQASTKIYRNPLGRPCSHQLKATVGEDSLLVLAPDPVQAFTGSTYVQRQDFYLSQSSGLVLVDWLSSGREARGERWAFNRYQSRNQVFLNNERIVADSLLIDTANGAAQNPHRLGRFNCLALLMLIGEPVRIAAAKLLEEINTRPVTRRAALVTSASAVSHGTLLRVAGEQVEEVGRELHRHLAFLGALLQDDPWSRKW